MRKIWPEILISCTCCPESALQKVGTVCQDSRRASNIGYLPVVDAPVTDMATVNEILRHSVSICQRLQLPEIGLVFDEAIYSKAQMIRWKDEELKKRLVIRFGEFHTVMSFCHCHSEHF
jgi:hypothetical protein